MRRKRNKMAFKDFIKPSVWKIIIFIVLMGGINYYLISTMFILDARILVGVPLGFYPIGSFFLYSGQTPPVVEFSYLNFIIDLIFWYLISCLIIFTYTKIRSKK